MLVTYRGINEDCLDLLALMNEILDNAKSLESQSSFAASLQALFNFPLSSHKGVS